MDAGLGLGLHETFRRRGGRDERLCSASCALDLCPVTTGNFHRFYDKISSTEVLHLTKFGYNLSLYDEMTAITYMKTELNYSKYIFNGSISIQATLQPKIESPFCHCFFDTVYHNIQFTQCSLS